MKKLLSLLSVVTITGTAVPTTIAASPYEKQEKNKLQNINEIIYQQTNSLETLDRVKRENNNKLDSWSCFLCPRRFSIEISHNNWKRIRIEQSYRTKDSLYNFVYSLFKNEFENIDSLTNNDIEILSNVVCDKFNDIDNIFKYKNDDNIGLIIRTNRESYWSISDNWWGVHLNKEIKNNDYNGNELNFSGTRGSVELFYLYFTFKPEFWEEIRFLYNKYNNNNDIDSFANEFKEKSFNHKDSWVYYIVEFEREKVFEFGKRIWTNWDSIDNLWQNSNRRNRIKLVGYFNSTKTNDIYSKEILDDETYRENKYLDKLENDLEGNKNLEIDLGLIEDDDDNSILNKVKEMFPKLDISQLEIIKKEKYSFLSKKFSAKINVKNNSNIYSISFQKKLNFISKKFLKEDMPRILGEENLIKNWDSNFNEWKNEINRQKIQDLPNYGNDERGQSLKRTWKGNNFSELKNKLLSLNHILETIDNKFKINELYKNVQGLQNDINNLKQQITELNQKIDKLKIDLEGNKNLETCSKAGSFISATTGWIPIVGNLISTVSGLTAVICDVAA